MIIPGMWGCKVYKIYEEVFLYLLVRERRVYLQFAKGEGLVVFYMNAYGVAAAFVALFGS